MKECTPLFCPHCCGTRANTTIITCELVCTRLCVAFFAILRCEKPLPRLFEHDTLIFEYLVQLFGFTQSKFLAHLCGCVGVHALQHIINVFYLWCLLFELRILQCDTLVRLLQLLFVSVDCCLCHLQGTSHD